MTNSNNTREQSQQQSFNHRLVFWTKRILKDYYYSWSSENTKGEPVMDAELKGRIVNTPTPRLQLQFFVKLISGGKSLVLQANLRDTVELVHSKIQAITKIPVDEQRLIYRGKQLEGQQTLEECGVENDSVLQLVARLRSTNHPAALLIISDMVSVIYKLCRHEIPISETTSVKQKLVWFMEVQSDVYDRFKECTSKTFMDACAPQALVMMYMSPEKRYQECADDCIRYFVMSVAKDVGSYNSFGSAYCAKIVLEFCRLLRMSSGPDDVLYKHCRSTLGMMLDKVAVEDVFEFLKEVGQRLVQDLVSQTTLGGEQLVQDISDFTAFLKPVLEFIGKELAVAAASRTSQGKKVKVVGTEVTNHLYCLFNDLLTGIDKCLRQMGLCLAVTSNVEVKQSGWSRYLAIIKELSKIAAIYPGSERRLRNVVRNNSRVVLALALDDDHCWLSPYFIKL